MNICYVPTAWGPFKCQNSWGPWEKYPASPSSQWAWQSFKQSLIKLKEGSIVDRVSHVLFHSHLTLHSTTRLSPAELLVGRRLRSRLDLLQPDIEAHVYERQSKQQLYSNRHA